MTKLPSDSFLPSGALDSEARISFNGQAGSGDSAGPVVSPLSTARKASQFSYFDMQPNAAFLASGSKPYSPIPPGSVPNPYLSPQAVPMQSQVQRPASLSPTRRGNGFGHDVSQHRQMPFPTSIPGPIHPGNLAPRSISADAASTSSAATIRRLAAQNGLIREAWEAERRYLEANRSRAEEVYKEER